MANSVDPDQTAPIGAVCSGSTLFASILKSVMLGNYLQKTTSADGIFRCALRVNMQKLIELDKGTFVNLVDRHAVFVHYFLMII